MAHGPGGQAPQALGLGDDERSDPRELGVLGTRQHRQRWVTGDRGIQSDPAAGIMQD
jgi:hypothetical protein